jgi:hypothetical protein
MSELFLIHIFCLQAPTGAVSDTYNLGELLLIL